MELKARRINEKRVEQQKTSRGQQELKKRNIEKYPWKAIGVWKIERKRDSKIIIQ